MNKEISNPNPSDYEATSKPFSAEDALDIADDVIEAHVGLMQEDLNRQIVRAARIREEHRDPEIRANIEAMRVADRNRRGLFEPVPVLGKSADQLLDD